MKERKVHGVVDVATSTFEGVGDEAIVVRVVAGDQNAYAIIVRRYESKLRAYGHRFLASHEDIEDQVQEVFLKAYQNLKAFDPKRRFSPWIYRIAHNTFVNALRTRVRHPLLFFDPDVLTPHAPTPGPDREYSQQEIRELLERGVNQLDPKYREPMILFYFEELSYQDIADALHIPVSTVGVRISRGRRLLRQHLADPS